MGDLVEGEQWLREIRWEAVAVAQVRVTVAWSRAVGGDGESELERSLGSKAER